jgi:hypothetical protein
MRMCLWAVVVAGFSATLWVAQSPAADEMLFNGKDLAGWTCLLDDASKKMEDVWSVQDGVLICAGLPVGYLRTEKEYENYVLELEWRWPKDKKPGNNGVLVHTTTEHALKVWPKSLEIQLAHGQAGDFWVIGTTISVANPGERTTDRRTANFTDDSEKPIGEWNKLVVVCSGDTVTCIVNGDVVNCGWNASQSKGAICLQSEKREVHFRNIRLRHLSD